MSEPKNPKTIDALCDQPPGTFKAFVKSEESKESEPTKLQKTVETVRMCRSLGRMQCFGICYPEWVICELLTAAKQLQEREAFIRLQESLMQDKDKQLELSQGAVIDRENMVKDLRAELKQEKIWKEEDPRMLREQMRVHDIAFQHLHDQRKALQKENEELKIQVAIFGPGATNYALAAQERDNLKLALESTRAENARMREALMAFKDGIRYESQEAAFRLLNEVNI